MLNSQNSNSILCPHKYRHSTLLFFFLAKRHLLNVTIDKLCVPRVICSFYHRLFWSSLIQRAPFHSFLCYLISRFLMINFLTTPCFPKPDGYLALEVYKEKRKKIIMASFLRSHLTFLRTLFSFPCTNQGPCGRQKKPNIMDLALLTLQGPGQ